MLNEKKGDMTIYEQKVERSNERLDDGDGKFQTTRITYIYGIGHTHGRRRRNDA